MKFKIGDRVRFLNDVGEATVIAIKDGNTVVIEDESGFDYDYAVVELLLVDDKAAEHQAYDKIEPTFREILDRNMDEQAVKSASDDFKLKYKNRNATNIQRKGEEMEVDLHIHQLIDSEVGLNPSDKLQIQMSHFDRSMDMAKSRKITKLIFIHGVGQGVLRHEIRTSIEQYYPEATFHDADYRKYGYGATEVRIRYGAL